MGGGNGAKSAQKRERNQKNAGAAAKSQLKVNAAAMDIQCKQCFQAFFKTTREPALKEHIKVKHNDQKTFTECFPTFVAGAN